MKIVNRAGKLYISLKTLRCIGAILIALLISSCSSIGKASPTPTPTTPSVEKGGSWLQMVNGHLVYGQDAQGNQIPDFSAVGYGGGGVPLPNVPTQITLNPQSTGDDTPRIQQALDQVAKLTPNAQ